MTIAVTYGSQITVVETLVGNYVAASDNTVTTGMSTTANLTASTTPPVSKHSEGQLSLTSGSASGGATLDLTILPDNNGNAGQITLTGLKLATVKFRNKATNANSMTITKGASNGCTSLGAAFSITLQVGEEVTYYGQALAASVDATHKTFDVTGSGNQILEFAISAG